MYKIGVSFGFDQGPAYKNCEVVCTCVCHVSVSKLVNRICFIPWLWGPFRIEGASLYPTVILFLKMYVLSLILPHTAEAKNIFNYIHYFYLSEQFFYITCLIF